MSIRFFSDSELQIVDAVLAVDGFRCCLLGNDAVAKYYNSKLDQRAQHANSL